MGEAPAGEGTGDAVAVIHKGKEAGAVPGHGDEANVGHEATAARLAEREAAVAAPKQARATVAARRAEGEEAAATAPEPEHHVIAVRPAISCGKTAQRAEVPRHEAVAAEREE